jgi:exodeoxyribonuclease VII small subunit
MPDKEMRLEMNQAEKPIAELSYEEAFSELEQIVEALENNQQALEDSLKLYERGQALSQYCAKLLEEAELKVRKLSDDLSLEELNQ